MATLERFDDISGLVCYFSGDPTESNIVKSGNNVTSVDSAYGGQAVQLTQSTANLVTHDGTTMVGQVPAFIGLDGVDHALEGTLPSPFTMSVTGGCTVAILEQRRGLPTGFNSMTTTNSSDTALVALTESSDNYGVHMGGSTYAASPSRPIDTNANVVLARYTQGASSIDVNINNVYSGTCGNSDKGDQTHAKVSILGSIDGLWSAETNIAIAVVYNRKLTEQEATDVVTLMLYWRDNGEAPNTVPGTSVTFGPVATNDDASVTGWQWEASTDGGNNWDNAETVMSDVSGQTTNTLTVNSASIGEDQTMVQCRATSASQPAGVVSNAATLTVVSG
jgi:hypothetical protein